MLVSRVFVHLLALLHAFAAGYCNSNLILWIIRNVLLPLPAACGREVCARGSAVNPCKGESDRKDCQTAEVIAKEE